MTCRIPVRTASLLLALALLVALIAPAVGQDEPGSFVDAGPASPPDAAPAFAPPPDAAPAFAPPPDAAPAPDAGVDPDGDLDVDGDPEAEDDPPDAAGAIEPIPPPPLPPPFSFIYEEPPPAPVGADKGNRALIVIKLVGGLVALMVLAYLGGHRKVVRLQERLGIGGVIAAGFPFVALGLIAQQPEVGILTDEVLHRLRPILHFGLGWLGFIIGAQLDIRVLDKVPSGTGYLILVESLAPFIVTAGAIGGSLLALGGADLHDSAFWRDVIVVGVAAAMTAPRRFRGFANRTWREGRGVDHLLAQLDEIVGVIGLLFVAAYFRPDVAVGWQLPGTAWVFVSIGLGVVIGVVIFAIVRVPVSNAEFLAVVLGSIAFGSGLAGYLYLSPIAVCFIAGALVTNFPCEQRDSIFNILNHLERPIHLLFLIVVGATWNVFDWRGWVLVPMFVAARMIGKWTGIFAATHSVGGSLPAGYADQRTLVTPLSALAIALVVSVHGLTSSFWLATVVIGGAVLTEVLVSITTPPRRARPTSPTPLMTAGEAPLAPPPVDVVAAAPRAVDELDERSGPVYHHPDDDPDDDLPPMEPRPPTGIIKK
jgi:hypothetical protein